MVDPLFWRGRRVFVTGHTGFKGSWLALWLHAMGADIHGFALPADGPGALFDAAGVAGLVTHREGDVRHPRPLADALADAAPTIVIHMAAQPLVLSSYQDPAGTYATNLMGTVHLLEAVRRTPGIEAVIVVTTDKCYADQDLPRGYLEDDRLGGSDPYASSKACCELAVAAYRRSFFGSAGAAVLATARAGNVIGGGDTSPGRLVPDIMRALAAGQRPFLRNPGHVRPWQHVLACLDGYLTLAEAMIRHGGEFGREWNFGPVDADHVTVGTLASRLTALWGQAGFDTDPAAGPHESRALRLDCGRARHELGWSPRWALDEALASTVRWHRALLRGQDMQAAAHAEIAAYCGWDALPRLTGTIDECARQSAA